MKLRYVCIVLLILSCTTITGCTTIARGIGGGPQEQYTKPQSMVSNSPSDQPNISPIDTIVTRLNSSLAPTAIINDTGVNQQNIVWVDRDGYLNMACDDHTVTVKAQLAYELLVYWIATGKMEVDK